MSDCSFVLLASPRDTDFVKNILPHLLRMCSFSFRDVIVVADDLPKGIRLQEEENLHAQFFEMVQEWQRDSTISKCLRLSTISCDRLAEKYFGSRISAMRDYRGVPLFGWIAGLDAAESDFVVHFDSDILLHQASDYNWIEAGMDLIQEDPLAMFVSPLPGPPSSDGKFYNQPVCPTLDKHGNLRFKTFSSRRFLLSKRRFDKLLPTPSQYLSTKRRLLISTKRRLLMQTGLGNALRNWERCVSCTLQESSYYRVHLRSPKAWAIHCLDRGDAFIRSLPALIQRVEDGHYPVEQGGHHDLVLPVWNLNLL